MADVRPVPGIRYAATEDLAALVTPPYDVISPEAQERYYARDPHNIIRLELGRDEPGDDSLNNKYTRAATLFAEWRLEGVMRQDTPSLYAYEQTFSVADAERRRMGLLARVRLEPWVARVILPHERTMSKPKDDRLKLMHACAANLSPLMSLYDDPDQELSAILNEATTGAPTSDFADDAGERHRLWRLDDPALAQTVAAFFAPRQLYIADGHHRYETSLTYRDEVRAERKETFADDATDFVLMSLTAIEDAGLVVLPTHRILRSVSADDLLALPDRLERHFTVTPLEGDSTEAWRGALVEAEANAPSIALVTRDGAWLATLNDAGRAAMANVTVEGQTPGAAWRALDVAVLQALVFGEALGVTPDEIRAGDRVTYTRDAEAAVNAVRTGTDGASLAALLIPTPPEAMRDVAQAGDRMPQKSTYFYPKLITGLVINPLW
ncbi:MAG TPA: DUF1015 domain-containing protein [Ktedonobacterales bacterium]|jgi:uncharacterized protein (DUF1015 family)|nr:DUF1015 domain-containing protein [Ktedonobacterales bacterium]